MPDAAVMKRAILIVLDGVGVGELPDAGDYGDRGASTLNHVIAATGGLDLPALASLGLGRVAGVRGIPASLDPAASFGRMAELGAGKDSTAGHFELAGLVVQEAFPTYPRGFPPDLIEKIEKTIGRSTIGNFPCSGTEIIARLGEEHLRTGSPIVYTSADSVFQVAAHEDLFPLEELYRICETARTLLRGEHAVARVIARPFRGEPGRFVRTAGRRDYSLAPHGPTVLNRASEAGMPVVAVGKIFDLYAGSGITDHRPSKGNTQTIELLKDVVSASSPEEASRKARGSIIAANLVDFDMLYGHRNDPAGFARALMEFDDALPGIVAGLRKDDLLIITADHGNDPTTAGTDHTREYVPLLVCGPAFRQGVDLGTRDTFADVAATMAAHLELDPPEAGTSFLGEIAP